MLKVGFFAYNGKFFQLREGMEILANIYIRIIIEMFALGIWN